MTSLLAAVALGAAQGPAALDAEIETALGTAGLTTSSARFDEQMMELFRAGEFTTPLYRAASANPWRMPFLMSTLKVEAAGAAGSPSALVMMGGRLLGAGTRRTLLGNPNQAEEDAAKKPGALAAALNDMKRMKLVTSDLPSVDKLPEEVRQAAALILRVALRTVEMRRLAFAKLGELSSRYDAVAGTTTDLEGMRLEEHRDMYQKVDLSYLFAGGHDLAKAAETAMSWIATVPPTERYRVAIETTWGDIVLSGGTSDGYPDAPILLAIDTGGNDVYLNAPRNANPFNWASVILDAAGDDQYVSSDSLRGTAVAKYAGRKSSARPGPASALFGYAVLIDRRGNDLYRSHSPSMGSARFGVATLLDSEGNDTYDAYRDSQGFGMFGIGVLEDRAGTDTYQGFSQIQGCGMTMGFGMLADREGDDTYTGNDEVLDFPSAQSAEHNTTMGQGAGYGRRADYSDGHSLAGGVGILLDEKGSDTYSAGVFAQGAGYWEGVGMLWDLEGNDKYTGQWYVQGASAHFAIGYLEDSAGDDKYTAPMNMAQGAGHDFAIGFLVEGAGADQYKAPNLSLGAGNANGIGVLLEMGGNDTYDSSGITLGRAAESTKGSLRSKALCLGTFIDFGGRDVYPAQATWAKEGAKVANWTDKLFRPEESQVGVFWDK